MFTSSYCTLFGGTVSKNGSIDGKVLIAVAVCCRRWQSCSNLNELHVYSLDICKKGPKKATENRSQFHDIVPT